VTGDQQCCVDDSHAEQPTTLVDLLNGHMRNKDGVRNTVRVSTNTNEDMNPESDLLALAVAESLSLSPRADIFFIHMKHIFTKQGNEDVGMCALTYVQNYIISISWISWHLLWATVLMAFCEVYTYSFMFHRKRVHGRLDKIGRKNDNPSCERSRVCTSIGLISVCWFF
jgi:hypothetical protein